jgi:hypothetical protein
LTRIGSACDDSRVRGGRVARLLLAGALALSALGAAAPAWAAFPGATGLLAFQSDRGGDYGIWLANPDGSGPHALFDGEGTDEFNPAWAPGGDRLVYQSGPLDGADFDLWLIGADGTGRTPLLTGSTNDRAAQFCDQETIVFTRQTDPANADVWAIGAGGGQPVRLTTAAGIDSFPTCSPDGRHIVFISNRDGAPAIWQMDRDGSHPEKIVEGFAVDPDYAPDGSAIAYSAVDPGDGNLEIFTKDLATGQVVQRTHTAPPVQNRLAHFAPAYGAATDFLARSPLLLTFAVTLYFTSIDGEGTEHVVADLGRRLGASRDPCDPQLALLAARFTLQGGPNSSAGAAGPEVACDLTGGTLTVRGTAGAERIVVKDSGMSTAVEVNGKTVFSKPASDVTQVKVFAGRGDVVTNNSQEKVSVSTADPEFGISAWIVSGKLVVEANEAGFTLSGIEVKVTKEGGKEYVDVLTTDEGQTTGTRIARFEKADVKSVKVKPGLAGEVQVDGSLPNVEVTPGIGPPGSSPPKVTRTKTTVAVTTPKQPATEQLVRISLRPDAIRISPLLRLENGLVEQYGIMIFDTELGRVTIQLWKGNDTVDVGPPEGPRRTTLGGAVVDVRVDTGTGDDTIDCRDPRLRCQVSAGAGNDVVDVRDGARNVVDAGKGRDRVLADPEDVVRNAEIVVRG